MELIDVETIRTATPRHAHARALIIVAGLGAVGVAAALWLAPSDEADQPPLPTPIALDGNVSLEQAVALAWADWQAQVATSECLAAHDFAWAPTIEGESWIVPAAQRLNVEPRYVDVVPRPETANPITLELEDLRIEESDQWYAPVEDGGCIVAPALVNLADAEGIDAALAAAAADEPFKEALAGEAWRREHPEAWLAHWTEAYFAIDRSPLHDRDAATAVLDDAVEVASAATSWVPIGELESELAVSAYGVDGAGHVVVISIEESGAAHPVTWAFGGSARNQLHCDGFQLMLSTPALASGGFVTDDLSRSVWKSLTAGWCGAGQ